MYRSLDSRSSQSNEKISERFNNNNNNNAHWNNCNNNYDENNDNVNNNDNKTIQIDNQNTRTTTMTTIPRSKYDKEQNPSHATATPVSVAAAAAAPQQQQRQDDTTVTPTEEWVFSIRVPGSVSGTARTSRWLHLKQQQQPKQKTRRSPPQPQPQNRPDAVVVEKQKQEQQQQQQQFDLSKEQVSPLLRQDELDQKQQQQQYQYSTTSTTTSTTTGWRFQSPSSSWSLESDTLLKITFFPAWQALPAYTRSRMGCCSSGSGQGGSVLGNYCCGGDPQSSIDFTCRIYTTADILHATQRDDYWVQGIGVCQAVQLHLKPLCCGSENNDNNNNKRSSNRFPPPVPDYLQEAWDEQVAQIQASRLARKQEQQEQQQQQHTPTATTAGRTRDNSIRDGALFQQQQQQQQSAPSSPSFGGGPILTFCLPKNKNNTTTTTTNDTPPLLWKVDIPAMLDTPIALETISVLDQGHLIIPIPTTTTRKNSCTTASQDNAASAQSPAAAERGNQNEHHKEEKNSDDDNPLQHDDDDDASSPSSLPTHIYLNGYQSWSFAGSLPKGAPQPKSGLPNVFSRAFNYGASPPPPSSSFSDTTTNTNTAATKTTQTQQQQQPFQQHYQSDFFTCITSDRIASSTSTQRHRQCSRGNSTTTNTTTSSSSTPAAAGPDTSYGSGGGSPHAEGCVYHRFASSDHHLQDAPCYQQLDETGGPALLLGWLSQRRQFGVVTATVDLTHFQMHCSNHGQILLDDQSTVDRDWCLRDGNYQHRAKDDDVDEYGDTRGTTTHSTTASSSISTDWAYAQLISPHSYDEEPMVHYLHAVASRNQARPLQNGSLLTGWCSWYFAYERISADLLRDNFATLAAIRTTVPTNVAVVDDGYMTAWGDWDSVKPNQFPSGLSVVSRDISSFGMRPGLWLAPFAADKHSKLAKDHPNWIIQNHAGVAANSSHCGKFFYGLDATHPNVRKHVHEAVKRAVQNWGFNVLKIDFLYAACLEGNGKYDLSMSRAEAMDWALQTIRHAAGPNVFLIGCGCPIGSAIGWVDAMRVSADTGPTWYPAMPLPWWDEGTLPALRSMVRNSVARAPLGHRWWHNDPDCLMFGEHTRLTNEEVASAASIVAMTCGMLLLSDDLPKVPPQRIHILTKIFPMTGVSAVVLDLHSTYHGLPSLMRLWCTDKYDVWDQVVRDSAKSVSAAAAAAASGHDHNAQATFFARRASFRLDDETLSAPEERERSCIHVTKGLGTWTVVSISNWLDQSEVVTVPPPALLPPPKHGWKNESGSAKQDNNNNKEDNYPPVSAATANDNDDLDYGQHGYHVFAFWSSRYSWVPRIDRSTVEASNNSRTGNHDETTIRTKLAPHATEIFHIKPVLPDQPQYIGSDMHFSCGQEVTLFKASYDSLEVWLNPSYRRSGTIYVFIPRINTTNIRVQVNGDSKSSASPPPSLPSMSAAAAAQSARWSTVGNTPSIQENGSPRLAGRVIAVPVIVRGDGSPLDGQIKILF